MTNDLTCPSGAARCVNMQCVYSLKPKGLPRHTQTHSLFLQNSLFFKQVLLIFLFPPYFWTEGSSFVGRPVFLFCFSTSCFSFSTSCQSHCRSRITQHRRVKADSLLYSTIQHQQSEKTQTQPGSQPRGLLEDKWDPQFWKWRNKNKVSPH